MLILNSALLRLQTREVLPRRMHAVLPIRRSTGGVQEFSDEVQGLYGWVWVQDMTA